MSLLYGSEGMATRGSFSDLVALVLILCLQSVCTASEARIDVLTLRWLSLPASCSTSSLPVGRSTQEHGRTDCLVAYA